MDFFMDPKSTSPKGCTSLEEKADLFFEKRKVIKHWEQTNTLQSN